MAKKAPPKWSEEQVSPGATIIRSGVGGNPRKRLLVATPTLGNIRIEWAMARYGQITPCNWASHDIQIGVGFTVPMHYLVADAQNMAVEHMLQNNFDWLLLWEDDVIAPMDAFTRFDEYIMKEEFPVVSGLYFLKCPRSEPLVYRGRGERYFSKFRLGDLVFADGVPTGMLLVHRSLLELMYNESEPYQTLGGRTVRRVFETPCKVVQDKVTGQWNRRNGTSDLAWCTRVLDENVLRRAGWSELAKLKYPFLVDTNILCKHIDLNTGIQFPTEDVLKFYRAKG